MQPFSCINPKNPLTEGVSTYLRGGSPMPQVLIDTIAPNNLREFSDSEMEYLSKIIVEKLPRHIAIIMDGNGRWAKQRRLPRNIGHRQGLEALKRVVEVCGTIGIEVLTVYAFSTENWRRPQKEVNFLMNLAVEWLEKEIDELNENNVKVIASGTIEELTPAAYEAVKKAIEQTKGNTGLILNVALNYGGRDEIIRAAKAVARLVGNGDIQVEEIDPSLFEKFLFTAGLPDPDLIIRTSGEQRLSNFLLWQLAYAEFNFVEVLWPDFGKKDLLRAVLDYQQRNRRFGALNSKDGE